MTGSLARTPLHAWHAAHGGRLVDFAGWEMPVQYTSIVDEHRATRNAVGLFDVSHMGRLKFNGPGAEPFLDRVVTRRVTGMRPGLVRYALVTNDAGSILDDVLVYRLSDCRTGETYFQLVVNASNREKILAWLEAQEPVRDGVQMADLTTATAMIAVQGPRASELLATPFGELSTGLKYYHATEIEFAGARALVSRTGYTGEDGWELVVPADRALDLWQDLLERGAGLGAQAAGLGARDTLRLEAAMPLYGHELSEQIDPFQAGLGFAVDLEGRTFPGHAALQRAKAQTGRPVRVGWELASRRVPREGFAVSAGGRTVGHVTSGTFSPTLDRPIAMGYTEPALASVGSEVSIDIRDRQEPARVVPLPFYRRPTQGSKS